MGYTNNIVVETMLIIKPEAWYCSPKMQIIFYCVMFHLYHRMCNSTSMFSHYILVCRTPEDCNKTCAPLKPYIKRDRQQETHKICGFNSAAGKHHINMSHLSLTILGVFIGIYLHWSVLTNLEFAATFYTDIHISSFTLLD